MSLPPIGELRLASGLARQGALRLREASDRGFPFDAGYLRSDLTALIERHRTCWLARTDLVACATAPPSSLILFDPAAASPCRAAFGIRVPPVVLLRSV
ncbi:hypothetical protein BH24ACT3_BH24ACT3_04120 [soil metagenome]